MITSAPDRQIAHEVHVAGDLTRKAAVVAPAVVALAAVVGGVHAAVSALIALALVSTNFLVAAMLIARAAPLGPAVMATATVGGFVARIAALVGAILALRTQSWIDLPVLVVVIGAAHVTLLFWEMRAVSLSAAYPGLRPPRGQPAIEGES